MLGLVFGLLFIAIDMDIISISYEFAWMPISYEFDCMSSFNNVMHATNISATMVSVFYLVFFWINKYEKLPIDSTIQKPYMCRQVSPIAFVATLKPATFEGMNY